MSRKLFLLVAILLMYSLIIISCATVKSLNDEKAMVSNCFSEEDFEIVERKIINKNYSYYIVKEKNSNQYYIFYLDEYKYCEGGDYYISGKLIAPPLDSNQYVRSGSFLDKNGEKQVVISIEEFIPEGIPGYSTDFYYLWILNKKRDKFVEKNENKYLRIHLSYYLKSDTSSYNSDEDYIELMKSKKDK